MCGVLGVTCVEHVCITHVSATHALHKYFCTCNTCIDIHLCYTCNSTHVILLLLNTCIICVKHVYYRCSTHVLWVGELHMYCGFITNMIQVWHISKCIQVFSRYKANPSYYTNGITLTIGFWFHWTNLIASNANQLHANRWTYLLCPSITKHWMRSMWPSDS